MQDHDKQDGDGKKFEEGRWIGCPLEEELLGSDRKATKQMRKQAMMRDRSKFKKTDSDRVDTAALHRNIKLSKEELKRGRVLSITPEGIVVDCDGELCQGTLRGLLKKEHGRSKNLVTIGDIVLLQPNGLIAHVEPRQSVLSRADNLSRRKEQLIAANIDQVIITGSVVLPPLKPPLLDRYIIAAYKGKMAPLVVINKIDLLNDPAIEEAQRQSERGLLEQLVEGYRQSGIPCLLVSSITCEGLEPLRHAMQGKASVLSGQSGVGKSSLINALTGLQLKTGDVVAKTLKGSHTTTTAQLLPLEGGGWCIDTPGIKSFGLWDLKQQEIGTYYSEIAEVGKQCHFSNCTHSHENGCAVMDAVEKGAISILRYQSYLQLMESTATQHKRR